MTQDKQSDTSGTNSTVESPALVHLRKTLAPLYQENPVAMCITNRQAQLTYANQAFLNILQADAKLAPIKGQALHKLFPQSSRLIIDHIETLVGDERSASLKKTLHLGREHNPTAMQITVQLLPATDGQPSEGALLTFQQDASWYQSQYAEDKQTLTARIRQLSTDLMDRQSLLKAMMNHSPFGIALLDKQRRVIQLNRTAEKILGVPRSAARGILCNSLFQCFEQGQRCPVLDDGNNIDQQETTCAQPGKTNNVFLRSVVHSMERDEDIIIEAFIDITEMKDAQQAKEAAYRAQEDFFAKMSHELRTPLNAVIGYSELIADENHPLTAQELKEYAGAIERSGYDLLHLVNQVLDIAKLSGQKVDSDPLNLQPKVVINEVSSTIQPLAAQNHNHFSACFADDTGTVYADPEHLRAILLNLLSNACKFTKHGKIKLNVQREIDDSQEWVVFQISDTGIGLNQEQIKRIFNRFEQANNSTTRSYGGSGLGLSIARDLCELMGGNIEVKSQVDEGSVFTVKLPGQEITNQTND